MLSVALATLVWIPALVGLGSLVGYAGDPALRRVVCGLVGLGVAGAAATALNLVVPIGPAVSLAIWTAGAAALVARRRFLAEGLAAAELAAAALALALLPRAIQDPATFYDSGLYYGQAIRWITERPLQLGLANLHDRLGLNSLWHVTAAALELPYLAGRSGVFVNVLPVVLAAAAAGVGVRRVLAGSATASDLALALALPVAAHATAGIGAASPDQAAAVLVYLSLALWVRALEADDRGFAADARAALLLGVLAATVKLSSAPVVVAAIAAFALRRRALPREWWAGTALAVLAILVPWALRSVLLSGCVVFPEAHTCVTGLPWAVPRADAEDIAGWIRAWPRAPHTDPSDILGTWEWLPAWAERVGSRSDVRFFAGTAALGGLAFAAAARRAGAAVLVPVATAALGIAYVFLSAPDPRFALGFLHAFALLPLAFALSRARPLARPWAGTAVVAAIVVLSASWLDVARAGSVFAPDPIAFPQVPSVATMTRVSPGGVTVVVPVQGEQCWAAPLPCVPAVPRTMRERGRIYSNPR